MSENCHEGCIEFDSGSVQHACDLQENLTALLWVGMMDFFWIGHCIDGMETLTRAATEGDAEADYVCDASTV
ncbi:hypothetical protein AHAS_Ahas11G0195800 [Arachis hypogaea]